MSAKLKTYDPADVAAAGYTFTDLEYGQPPGYPTLLAVAKRLDYSLSDLHFFRHAADSWGLWIKPNAVKGYKDAGPLLPFRATIES